MRRYRIAFPMLMLGFLCIVSPKNVVAMSAIVQAGNERCEGPVYEAKEVSQRAHITHKPEPKYTAKAREKEISGRVMLTAVLCKNGQVTDIKIVQGLKAGLTEQAIDAASKITFKPAEKDGVQVSQAIELEYNFRVGQFSVPGHGHLAKEPVEDRPIEKIALIGLVCRSREEVWGHIKTRTGHPYHKTQADQDLEALLGLGYFDRKNTYLRVEEGEKGGVTVVFIVKELPVNGPCDKEP